MAEDDELLELVLAVQNAPEGERAFGKLDRRVRPWVLHFFQKKRFTADEVEDLTQEAMLRVYNGLKDFRLESTFKYWFFEILTNVFRNEIRRRRSAKRDGFEVSLDTPPSYGEREDAQGPDFEVQAGDSNALEEFIRREGMQRFRLALEELPAQMRRVCLLRFVHELKYREVAVLLQISIETVNAHLHQAKKRLTERLGD
jgi:RNA polymerase sigma-70 factor, ECF subfamily